MNRCVRDAVEGWCERAVDLDGVDVRHALGEVARQHAEPGPDLEDDIIRLEGCESPDDLEDVLVDEEVLAEAFLRNDAHRSSAADALASICAPSCSALSPLASARAARVWTT